MDFSFSDDQLMFRDAVRDLLANECPPAVVRSAWENETGRTDGLWAALAEMGVVGMTAPESAGGLGMDETDLVLLLEEAGRAALPEPLLEHTAVGLPTLAEAGGPVAEAWLERAAVGEATLAAGPAEGYTVNAASSDLVLLIGDQVQAVPVTDASLVEHQSIDGSRRLFEVAGDATVLDADPAVAFDRAAALPPEEQERFATLVLAELDADREWSRLFDLPESDDLLDRLASEALSAHRQGGTALLNPESL